MEQFGKFCFATLLVLLSTTAGGFVFMKMWEWFIAPTFNVQTLSFVQSIGIFLFLTSITAKKVSEDLTSKELFDLFSKLLLYDALMLGVAWIITLFL
jgi:hypothetical protein